MNFPKLIIQPDPEHVGKHPLHECRYITTENFTFEDPHENQGSIICSMRDIVDAPGQKAWAQLLSTAPEMLEALQCVLASAHPHPTEHRALFAAFQKARAAIAKAEGRQS